MKKPNIISKTKVGGAESVFTTSKPLIYSHTQTHTHIYLLHFYKYIFYLKKQTVNFSIILLKLQILCIFLRIILSLKLSKK